MHRSSTVNHTIWTAIEFGLLLLVSACTSGSTDDAGDAADINGASTSQATSSTAISAGGAEMVVSAADCEETAALFATRGSANPDLDEPEVVATCDGETIAVVTNAIPDYTYIRTSPGVPGGRELTFMIPAEPTLADVVSDVPYIGAAAVTLGGVPIYGATEGTGGDVDSLPGIISACGSHNGPTGFHTHKILTSSETDCIFTPEEVASAPQLVGYAPRRLPDLYRYRPIHVIVGTHRRDTVRLRHLDSPFLHGGFGRPRPMQRTYQRRWQLRLVHNRGISLRSRLLRR